MSTFLKSKERAIVNSSRSKGTLALAMFSEKEFEKKNNQKKRKRKGNQKVLETRNSRLLRYIRYSYSVS